MTTPKPAAGFSSPRCPTCQAELSPGATFCHRCGRALTPGRPAGNGRASWIAAGVVVLVSAVGIAFLLMRPPQAATRPRMGGGAAPAALTGPAPDISALTPRQGFDRLYNRVMTAAEQGDTATQVRLTEHALAAYTQLDSTDTDGRYHAAVLHAQVGQFPEALALADTILAADRRDLLGLLIQGIVAELRKDQGTLLKVQQEFLAAWPARDRKRADYLDHQTMLDDFRKAAEAAAQ
jgi:hypothetical protein